MFFFIGQFEQLQIDPPEASLKRVEMQAEPGHTIEAALPDEFKGDRSGPLFFPNPQDEERFKEKFANCRVLPLSRSSFTGTNGEYHLRIDRTGIPNRSYYALSLPPYAVPSQIAARDPRSDQPLDKYVVRDDTRKCYVIYVECQSANGTFDFRLDIKFTIQKRGAIFEHSEYPDDGHVKRYARGLGKEKSGVSPEHIEVVKRLLADMNNQDAAETGASLPVDKTSKADRLPERLRKGKRCAQVIDEMKRIKRLHDQEGLTTTEIEEQHKDFEVWKIVKNCPDPKVQQHFRSPGMWERKLVGYALFILSKEFGGQAATSTIYDWVKEYRRYARRKT
jgi:hypothetical protein